MTDKEIISELNHIRNSGVSISGRTALRLAMEKIEKLEKIEQLIERTVGTLGLDNYTVQQIKEILKRSKEHEI